MEARFLASLLRILLIYYLDPALPSVTGPQYFCKLFQRSLLGGALIFPSHTYQNYSMRVCARVCTHAHVCVCGTHV